MIGIITRTKLKLTESLLCRLETLFQIYPMLKHDTAGCPMKIKEEIKNGFKTTMIVSVTPVSTNEKNY